MRYSILLAYLKIYNYLKNMVEENISQEFRLKYIDQTKNYSFEEIEHEMNWWIDE